MSLKLVLRSGRPNYYIRGTVRGIRCYEATGTSDKAAAEALRAKREAQLFEEAVYGKRAVASFQRAALNYLEFEERGPKDEFYVDRLVKYFGATPLMKVDQLAAEQAVADLLKPNAAPATKRRSIYAPLSAVLNHASRRGWCERPRFDMPKLSSGSTRWLSPQEVLTLIDKSAVHLKPLLHFLVCTGARMSEALNLEWSDVDLPATKVVFRNTKNGGDRVALLPPHAVVMMANLPLREGIVFRREDGEPYAQPAREGGGQIKTGWRGACRRAGITDASPHDLRHTWASWFYAVSKDPFLLKSEGGWKSFQMVERYAHLIPSEMVPEIQDVWGSSHPRIGALPGAKSAPAKDPGLKAI